MAISLGASSAPAVDHAIPARVSGLPRVGGLGFWLSQPDVPGFAELWGDAVFHCPFCHGWDVRDRPVAVFAAPEVARYKLSLGAGAGKGGR